MAKEQNYDYAHEMFAECVTNDPSNLVYVEAMMDNLQKKYKNNKKGALFKGFGGRGALKKAVKAGDWCEVLRLGPDFLRVNPWDVSTLRAIANACEALHYNEAELRYLKNALEANRKDIEVNRHCARSLARMGQFDQAIACWHRIEELRKGDEEAPRKISELTIQKARHAAGIVDEVPSVAETAARVHGKPAPTTAPTVKPTAPQPEPASIPLNRRQRLEKEISDHPTVIANYLELAELLNGEGRFPEAEKVLTRALAASGDDLKVREQLENAQIRRVRAQLAVAEKRAASLQSEEARELVTRVRSDLNRLELEIFGARSQRYPQDMAVRYELAVRLKRAGNYSEAVRYLNEAQQDAHYTVAATVEMGECLQHMQQYEKALECYRSAAQQAAADTQWKRLALYRAGVLATGLKDYQTAQKYLAQLVQIDSNYRDAAARLDKIRQMGDK